MFSFPSYLQHDSPQEHLRGMGVEALVRMTISMSICMSIRMSTHRSMRIHVHMFILHDNAQSIHMSIHMPIHSSRPTCIHLAAVARHFSHYSRALLWSWHFPSKKKEFVSVGVASFSPQSREDWSLESDDFVRWPAAPLFLSGRSTFLADRSTFLADCGGTIMAISSSTIADRCTLLAD